MIAIRVLAWSTVAFLLAALVEFFSHRYFMHRPMLERFGRRDIFEEHAILHHHEGRNDVGVDLAIGRHFLWSSPFIGLALIIDWFGALIFSAGILAYALLWTKLHRAI